MNSVNIFGRLAADAELRPAGATSKLTFRVAVNERYQSKDGDWKERASYIPCVIWGKRGESLVAKLLKGTQLAVSGKLVSGSYEKDGRKIYTLDVVADDVGIVWGSQPDERPRDVLPSDDNPLPF